MKKILIIGLVALGTAAGASIMTGRVFQEQFINLEAELSKDPRLEVLDNTINKGLFSSSGSMTLAMRLEENQRLIIESPWQASHFPGWVNYAGQTLLNLELGSQEVVNLLDEVGLDALQYEGTANWKKADFQMALEPFTFSDANAHLNVSGVNLTGTYHYSGEQVGLLTVANLAFSEQSGAQTSLDLKGFNLSWNQKGSYPWVQGTADLTAERIYVSNAQQDIELTQPSWKQSLVFNQQAFDYLVSLDMGKVTSQGAELGMGRLTLKTENFDGQAMVDLIEAAAANPNIDRLEEKDLLVMTNAFNRLLSASPAVVLQEFDLDLKAPIVFEQKTTGKLSFDGNNLPTNYLQQVESGGLDADDPINRTRLELNFSQLNPGLLMMIGIPTSMLNTDQAAQQLVFENGMLKLNGNHIPL